MGIGLGFPLSASSASSSPAASWPTACSSALQGLRPGASGALLLQRPGLLPELRRLCHDRARGPPPQTRPPPRPPPTTPFLHSPPTPPPTPSPQPTSQLP